MGKNRRVGRNNVLAHKDLPLELKGGSDAPNTSIFTQIRKYRDLYQKIDGEEQAGRQE